MAIHGLGFNDEIRKIAYAQGAANGAQQAALETGDTSILSGGNTETPDISAAEEDFTAAAAEAGIQTPSTAGPTAPANVAPTQGTEATEETEEEKKLKEEIQDLQDKKEENLDKMDKLEAHIEDLAKKAEENITKAAAQQEQAVKEHEKETQQAVDEQLQAYIEANKEGGEGMTRQQLQGNIEGALSDVPEVASAVSAALEANEQINEIDACLGDLNDLIQDTKSIEQEIQGKQSALDSIEEAQQAAAEAKKEQQCCDPIGFQATDKNGNQAQYDFIKDDGSFDSANDFLGSQNQWAEMQALDTDGDQIVTAQELQQGNIKAVKTNADGSQEIVDMAQEFGDDFSIDLKSYQQGGSHSAIDSTIDSDGDGTVDQELLGTFNVNANGQSIQGYNTLDDVDFLNENYGLSSEEAVSEDAESVENGFSQELQQHIQFFNTYTQKVQELKDALMESWGNLNLTEETFSEYNQSATKEASQKAANFFKSLQSTEEENENAATVEEQEEIPNQGESDLSADASLDEKELDKELEIFAA